MEEEQDLLDVHKTTNNQPFCAGVILIKKERMLVTLNLDGLPAELEGVALRIGGIGGGQEPGESILECAIREGMEELSTPISLVNSTVTFFQDLDTGELTKVKCQDTIAPLLFQRMTNPTPDTPYKHGNPIGPYIYFAIYLSTADDWDFSPGDDVQGLIQLHPSLWKELQSGKSIAELIEMGAQVKLLKTVDPKLRVYVPEKESFTTVAQILLSHLNVESS